MHISALKTITDLADKWHFSLYLMKRSPESSQGHGGGNQFQRSGESEGATSRGMQAGRSTSWANLPQM